MICALCGPPSLQSSREALETIVAFAFALRREPQDDAAGQASCSWSLAPALDRGPPLLALRTGPSQWLSRDESVAAAMDALVQATAVAPGESAARYRQVVGLAEAVAARLSHWRAAAAAPPVAPVPAAPAGRKRSHRVAFAAARVVKPGAAGTAEQAAAMPPASWWETVRIPAAVLAHVGVCHAHLGDHVKAKACFEALHLQVRLVGGFAAGGQSTASAWRHSPSCIGGVGGSEVHVWSRCLPKPGHLPDFHGVRLPGTMGS